jgi:hypothetical protein
MTDPHRVAGCNFTGSLTDWFSELDWAVYHAEGFEEWQEFRAGLVGTPIIARVEKLRARLPEEPAVQGTPEHAAIVRVLNYTRSLRGLWSKFPCVPELNVQANDLYARLNRESTASNPG